ncbi:hypothetical protein [Synechococcus sp. BIOS-E4-1]|uniref:hypothetical protein n=1 Tax=Synechococcus sp. BIOS-E4-1 TaxID=1400864 RepID=UPI001647A560|nr:hypothetical protein [Synechococcus sp. BIOS-E4-1]
MASPASALADPQSGEPEADTFTLPGDVNLIDSGDGEEIQEGWPSLAISPLMENQSIILVYELFLGLNPKKARLVDMGKSSVSTLGYVRLRDKNNRILFTIKQGDIENKLEDIRSIQNAKDQRRSKDKEISEIFESVIINVISGQIDEDLCLAFHQSNSEIQIQYRNSTQKPRSRNRTREELRNDFWRPRLNDALKYSEIIGRDDVSNITVEEIRSDEKKDVAGAAIAGIAMGFIAGSAGLLAGSTSGNYQNVVFKLNSPILGEFICEAKHDVYKHILGSCKSYF